jgi:hypothetical protein
MYATRKWALVVTVMKTYFAIFSILATHAFADNALVDCTPSSVVSVKGNIIDTDSEFVTMNANRKYRLISPNENTVGVVFNHNQADEDVFYFTSLGSEFPSPQDYVLQEDGMTDMYLQVERNMFTKGGKATMISTGTRVVTIWFLDCEL